LIGRGNYEEAIEHFEELRRRNMMFPGTHSNLADAYGSLGEYDKGLDVLQDYLRKYPENAAAHRNLGHHLVSFGRADEALEAYARAAELQPGHLDTELGRYIAFMLSEEWEQADAVASELAAASDPYRRISATVLQFASLLYKGKSQDVLELLEPKIASVPPGRMRAILHYLTGSAYMTRGNPSMALDQAQNVGKESRGSSVFEREGPCLKAKAAAELGQWEEVDEARQELIALGELAPSRAVTRRIHLLDGELALIRGDTDVAIDEIKKAEALLSKRGLFSFPPRPHVAVWFPLASAYLSVGDEEQAARYFERIVESTTERMWWPVPYVRSFYFLGKIYENRGETEKAQQYYKRFYEYWKDGDLDRERVAEAKSNI
jgi:tetratricopeptide (TPR) repeat protein